MNGPDTATGASRTTPSPVPGASDVTFVLPGLIQSGGVRAVLEIANHLCDLGVVTSVAIPERSLWAPRRHLAGMLQRGLGQGWMPKIESLAPRKPRSQDWFDLRAPLRVVPAPLWRGLGDSGVVVATSWRTAEEVARIPGFPERGVYFLQHHETWSGPPRRVDATWEAFERLIVSSEWLREIAERRFAKEGVGLAVYGVDHDVFTPADPPRHGGSPVVGFMWDPREWKGGAEVLAALERLRSGREMSVRAFGLGEPSDLPSWVEFAGRLTGDALAGFYRSLDVFVSGSWTETGPMTVPEAMACGIPVVTTDVGNVRLWSGSDGALSIVRPRDADALASALATLLDDPVERDRLSRAGIGAIAPFTWRRMASDFLAALRSFGLVGDAV